MHLVSSAWKLQIHSSTRGWQALRFRLRFLDAPTSKGGSGKHHYPGGAQAEEGQEAAEVEDRGHPAEKKEAGHVQGQPQPSLTVQGIVLPVVI